MNVAQLDVGGTLYKVSLDTLMMFPETFLSKLVSENWRITPGANNDPIFVDRDGDIFKYVLAWYHDNIIQIPRTVAIGTLKNDMMFFSLPDNVVVNQEKFSVVKCLGETRYTLWNEIFALWAFCNSLKIGYLQERDEKVYIVEPMPKKRFEIVS